MDAISYSTARAHLKSTMDRVCDDGRTVIITRSAKQSVVMMSLETFRSMAETAHLLGNPANASRLLNAVSQLERSTTEP